MIDEYIIINRKPKIIIKIFIYNIMFLMMLVIYLSNILTYTSYYSTNSYIFCSNNKYYLKLIIPIDKINLIVKKESLIINDEIYNYSIYKIDSNAINDNNIIIYLKVYGLKGSYKINNYIVKIKVEGERKKIIDYLKN